MLFLLQSDEHKAHSVQFPFPLKPKLSSPEPLELMPKELINVCQQQLANQLYQLIHKVLIEGQALADCLIQKN